MEDLCVLILAAGKGTRMISDRAKVLHKICGIPMLSMIYGAAAKLKPQKIFVVIGYDADEVRSTLSGCPVSFVLQNEQLGTGHAVQAAREELKKCRGDVLVILGDAPRIKTDTLKKLTKQHRALGGTSTLLTANSPHPTGYGRIIRSGAGNIEAIIEEKDATQAQRKLTEINPGFYCFKIQPLLEALQELSNNNAQGEYYLTDLVAIQRRRGMQVNAVLHEDFEELRGINSRKELAELSVSLGRQKNLSLMNAGVTFIDPDKTYVELDVRVGKDVVLYPMVMLEGNTKIGNGSRIRAGTRIANSIIAENVEVLDSCVIMDSKIRQFTTVGPFSHIHSQTTIGEGCRIENFVEVTRSSIGNACSAGHHAYLGDAKIGKNTTIGAGVITCNFDGEKKSATIIGEDVMVGADSQLIAPVKIGRSARIAAGSTITDDIPPAALTRISHHTSSRGGAEGRGYKARKNGPAGILDGMSRSPRKSNAVDRNS
jgi:bifunctional UDP-N-acetylglucosamine pyrophosphorylase / glucosamine-1-phosphate N-acetyltransferase